MTLTEQTRMEIDGAVMIITGAGSGIGAATARAANAAGAHLVLAGRRPERITAVADELLNIPRSGCHL